MTFRKKLITCGLALGLVISGASITSASVDGTQAQEGNLEVTKINKSEEIQPMFWAAVGRAVVAGYAWAKAGFDNSPTYPSYEYKDIKESFDY